MSRTTCLLAASLLLLSASSVSAMMSTYMKSNDRDVLYGIEAPAGYSEFTVYVDTDNANDSGFVIKGTGADFRVSSQGVFSWSASNVWVKVADARVTSSTFQKDGAPFVRWEAVVSRSAIQELEPCEEQSMLVFESNLHTTKRIVHRFTNQGNCYSPVTTQVFSTLTDITFELVSTGVWNAYKVYVDLDQSTSTGLKVDDDNLGADLMIHNSKIFTFRSGAWVESGSASYSLDATWGVHTWVAARSLLNDTDACRIRMLVAYECTGGAQRDFSHSSLVRVTSATDCFMQTVAVPSTEQPCTGFRCGLTELVEDVAPVSSAGFSIVNMAPRNGKGRPAPLRVRMAQKMGLSVLGYVPVNYAGRPIADVKAEIDRYFTTYPTINGILLDQMYSNDCKAIGYMCALRSHIRTKGGLRAITAANPGLTPPPCYMDCVDMMINADSTSDAFLASNRPESWVENFPANRFAHIVTATDPTAIPDIIARSRKHHAATLFITKNATTKWDELLPGGTFSFFSGSPSQGPFNRKAKQ